MVHNRINNARQLLTVATTDHEVLRIRDLAREKFFVRKIHLVTRTFFLGLTMVLVSEINVLRGTTLLLLTVLIGLSFYLIIESWNRCEKVTNELTQELSELRDLLSAA